jgi:signal transduction histidine kinase
LTSQRDPVTPVRARDRSLQALELVADQLQPLDNDPEAFLGHLSSAAAGFVGARRAGFFRVDGEAVSLQPKAHDIDASFAAELETVADVIGAANAVVARWGVGSIELGLLAAFDSSAPAGFSEDDASVLRVLAAAAALVWQQRGLTGRLLSETAYESDRLRGQAKRMGELEELKGHILNLAAHELRGPTAVIRGYLSMISDGSIDESGLRRIMPILLGKAAQMDALITQMLEVARLEEGRLDLREDRVDLGAAAREAIDIAGLLAPPGVSLFLEKPADPIFVLGDLPRITTIVANLLDNAVKYSPDGGQIRVKAGSDDGRGYVGVTDLGLGIAPADQVRLFTRFGRIVTPENSHISGTGLGLHLSRELARRQGGDITVESQPGTGSTFTLWLPLDVRTEDRPSE